MTQTTGMSDSTPAAGPTIAAKIAPIAGAAAGVRTPRPARFSAHVAAAFADGLIVILLLVGVTLVLALFDFTPSSRGRGTGNWFTSLDGALIGWGVWAAYTLGEVVFGSSPGKWLAADPSRVIRRSGGGGRASFRRRAVRWALKNSPVLLMFAASACTYVLHQLAPDPRSLPNDDVDALWDSVVPQAAVTLAVLVGVSTLWAIGGRRQTLHDRLAGTNLFDAADLPVTRKAAHGFEVRVPRRVLPLTPDER